ncbi:hypothetical protein niasHS_010192 [Heterodera schachtii]|uniref:RING-type domain-containing protein n=1 Tax=Heterodera schachtii TaxID=97005 RepID=A0ABD2IZJ2_HETSC
MALVKDNLDEIKSMFPDIELDAFLDEKLQMPVVAAVDLILENQMNFVKKRRKRTHDETDGNHADKTLFFSDPNSQNDESTDEVFLNEIDLENPSIHDFFVALAAHLDNLLQNRNEKISFQAAQIFDLVSCFAKLFTRVRRPLFQWLLKKNVAIEEVFIISFFIENQADEHKSFTELVERVVAERYKRQSLSQTLSNSDQLFFKPLVKLRTFDRTYQSSNSKVQKMMDVARDNFEKVLIEMVQNAENKTALKGIQWMGKSILCYFSKDTAIFECSVCFTESYVSTAFRCTAIQSSKDDSEKRHLFCLDCVRGQAEASVNEALLSEGALGLRCMASECRNPILFTEISGYLSRALRRRLDDRLTNQALCSAGLSGLEYCLKCDFAMIMEVPKEVDKVFNCQKCGYSFCRLCEEDWSKHFGFSCDKVKENSEEAKRREVEKKLNEAIVRCCPKCRLQFVKLDACNKMTCACGTTQCYICREVGITYEHFCNHPRDPTIANNKCDKCVKPKCMLWEDFKRHDREAIGRILKESGVEINIPASPMPGPSTKQQPRAIIPPMLPHRVHVALHLPPPRVAPPNRMVPPPQRVAPPQHVAPPQRMAPPPQRVAPPQHMAPPQRMAAAVFRQPQ